MVWRALAAVWFSFLLTPCASLAQTQYIARYKYFDLEEHLPMSNINQVLDHSDGSIWVSSLNGLYRYNGQSFELVLHDSLRRGIAPLTEDRQGNIWLSPLDGSSPSKHLWLLNRHTSQIVRAEKATSWKGSQDPIIAMGSDMQKNVWIRTPKAVIRWNGSRFDTVSSYQGMETYVFPQASTGAWIQQRLQINNAALPHNGYFYQMQWFDGQRAIQLPDTLNSNTYRIISAQGSVGPVLVYNRDQRLLYEGFPLKEIPTTLIADFTPVVCNGKFILWLHRADQQHILLSDLRQQPLAELHLPHPLHEKPWVVSSGNDTRFWLAVGKGQLLGIEVVPSNFQRLLYNRPRNYAARSIWTNDSLLYATGIPETVLLPYIGNRANEVVLPSSGLGLLRDKQGNVWVSGEQYQVTQHAGNQSIKYTYEPAFLDSLRKNLRRAHMQWHLHQDRQGRIWIAHAGGLSTIDVKKGVLKYFKPAEPFEALMQSMSYKIYENDKGLWVGTEDGIFQLSPQGQVVAHFSSYSRPALPKASILHFEEDQQGAFWLATRESGVVHWHPEKGLLGQYTTEQELPSNTVYACFLDDYGFLWGSTLQGVFRMNLSTHEVNIYRPNSGITHKEFNTGSAFKSASGRIYFGGLNGITAFHPKDFVAENDSGSAPHILRVLFQRSSDGRWQETALADSYAQVPNATIGLEINFGHYLSALTENAIFSYKIEGIHQQWQALDQKQIKLGVLPYGEHQLLIRAKDVYGNWTQPASLTIHILAPIYLRGWFIALMLLLLGSATYTAYQWRVRIYENRQQQLEAQVEARTAHIASQAKELEELNGMQARFFSNVSHELRTPLTLIFSPLQELMGNIGSLPPALVEQRLESINRNSRQLLQLVDEILDLSRLNTGAMQLRLEPCLANHVFSTIVTPFIEQAQYQKCKMDIDIDLDPQQYFALDINKTSKIINNLLSNALKYTHAGGSISFSVKETPECIRITVADTGIGIPAESLPYIFERFFQIDSSKGGAGIGLSFAKELASFIGGKLDVSSEVGKGSTFTLSVPKMSVAQGQEIIDKGLVVEDVAPSMAGSSILLVEDHVELRLFVRDLLAAHYEITTAANGAEAWALLEKTSFQLVISDVMMPELDGFGLLSKVRSSPQVRRTPFLLLTALSAAQHRIKGFATGVDDYLTKPFLPKELIVRVNNLLERHQMKDEAVVELEVSNLPVHDEDIQPQDWSWLREVEAVIRRNLPNHQFKMEDAAADMNLSYRQFSRKLNALTGLSPLYYQREIKLQVAREMLEETEYTPQRIADEIGFKKLHHLNTIFAERFGRSFSR